MRGAWSAATEPGTGKAGVLGWLVLVASIALCPVEVVAADADAALMRATALEAEARGHLRERRYTEGIRKAQEALALREQASGATHPDVTTSLWTLVELFEVSGRRRDARPLVERILRIQEQAYGTGDPRLIPGLKRLATHLRTAGEWAAARAALMRAVGIAEQAYGPHHPELAAILAQLGFVHLKMGEYVRSSDVLGRALRIEERTSGPDSLPVMKTGEYLAEALEAVGEYAEARRLVERSVRLLERQAPDSPALADRLTRLGHLLHLLGDLAAARQAIERAIRITERGGSRSPPLARAQGVLADLLQSQGDLRGARPLRERALSILEASYGHNFPWTAEANNDLADLLSASGEAAAARPYYERALDIGRRLGAPEPRWRAAVGLGSILEQQGRPAEALSLYREAVATVESLVAQFGEGALRQRYLEAGKRLATYDALARALLTLHEREPGRGYDREAMAVLEAKRGRIATEALAAARPTPQDPQVRTAIEDVRTKQDQAVAVERELREEQARPPTQPDAGRVQELTVLLARTKAEYVAEVQKLKTLYPRQVSQFPLQLTPDPMLPAKYADRLPAGTLVVEYFATPDALYLFMVAAGGGFQVKKRAVPQASLYALLDEYRRHLALGTQGFLPWADDGSATHRREVLRFQQVTRELGEHLLGPIDRELEAHRDLILVPNDLLHYLPYHALVRRTPGGGFRFLAETHTVSYMTQLELVDVLSPPAPPAPRALLAMGNPDGSLPKAGEEVRALRGVRPVVMAYEGSEATKARFLSVVAQLRPDVHLATHGVLDPLRPERSYLRMAGPDEESRRLRIAEIAGLELGNGLAILSACDTAVGETLPGAALISLAAAFSQAGAQSIVASLWQVSDEATRDFMVAYHAALATSGRAAALRAAQLALLGKPGTAHPYYWAAFILIGSR